MSKGSSIIRWILAVIATMALMTVVWFISSVVQTKSDVESFSVDDNWTVVIDGTTIQENRNLSEAYLGRLARGAQVDLYRELGEDCDGGMSIRFLVYLCSVETYVDDVEIYSYGTEALAEDIMVGSGYHFIELPDKVSGSTLHIHMVMNEPNAYTSISAPLCSPTARAQIGFANTLTINIFICLFLFILGIILSVVSIFAMAYDKVYTRLFLIGGFSTFMGLWSICANKILQIFSMNLLLNTNLEYISLFIAPIFFGILVYQMQGKYGTWRKWLIGICSFAITAFAVIAMILHYTNIVRFPKILVYFHIIGGICLIGIIIGGFVAVKESDKAHKIMSLAVFELAVTIGLDLTRFNIQKYMFQNDFVLLNSILPLGTMVFVILLLVSYLVSIYKMVLSKAERDTLTNLAYHDILTNLFNRAKCEMDFEEIAKADDDYAIINFDLNGLKYVNDQYGHLAGDDLIKLFAEALEQCFSYTGSCYRLGGDEFVAVVVSRYFDGIVMALHRMEQICKEKSEGKPFDIAFSYGLAYSTDVQDRDPHKIYSIADEKMYEMKLRSKGSRRFVRSLSDSEDE